MPHLPVPPPPGLAYVVCRLPGEALGGEAPLTRQGPGILCWGTARGEPSQAPSTALAQGSVGAQGWASQPASQSASTRGAEACVANAGAASVHRIFAEARARLQHCRHPTLPRNIASGGRSHLPEIPGPAGDKADR